MGGALVWPEARTPQLPWQGWSNADDDLSTISQELPHRQLMQRSPQGSLYLCLKRAHSKRNVPDCEHTIVVSQELPTHDKLLLFSTLNRPSAIRVLLPSALASCVRASVGC